MLMVNRLAFLLCAGLAFFFVGCGGEQFKATTDVGRFQEIHAQQQREKRTREAATSIPAPAAVADDPGDYLLGAGDLIVVTVFETPDLNSEARVSSRGFVSLPLINNVQVANLTAAEAEQKIEDLYQRSYLHDPHVTVYIKEHMSKQITLVGALQRPGTYDYVAKRRLLDVIAIGNGLTDKAGAMAYVSRQDETAGKYINYLVDLNELIRQGNMEQNMVIQGGDVIFVPEAGQVFVDGAVRKPGTYPISHSKMTVTEGIALAGGLASYANDESIKLIRYMGDGKEREIISISYSDLQGGLGDSLLLEDQDIIFAESSAMGTLISGSGFSLGLLGTGVNFKNPRSN
jgi:polysaccharide export outer membrane protein